MPIIPVKEVTSNAPNAATSVADTDDSEEEPPSTHSRCSTREEYIRSAEKIMIDGDIVVEILVLV
jgi:hypothetical protein